MKLAPLLLLLSAVPASGEPSKRSYPLEIRDWKVVPSESGPVNYYQLAQDPDQGAFLRGTYAPPLKTVVMGHEVPADAQQGLRHLHWKWRVQKFPQGANECVAGKGDSAATVYAVWRHGLAWFSLKFVWSASVAKGTLCAHHGSPVHHEDTVVLESGGPLNTWKDEEVDLIQEFKKHFLVGKESKEVPKLVGLGLITDGDQSHTPSSGDYAQFALVP